LLKKWASAHLLLDIFHKRCYNYSILGADMSNHKEIDQKLPKNSKPALNSKPLVHLQALAKNTKPKNIPQVNKTIMKKVGRGR